MALDYAVSADCERYTIQPFDVEEVAKAVGAVTRCFSQFVSAADSAMANVRYLHHGSSEVAARKNAATSQPSSDYEDSESESDGDSNYEPLQRTVEAKKNAMKAARRNAL